MPGARTSLFLREAIKPLPSLTTWQSAWVTGAPAVANGATTTLVFGTAIPVLPTDLLVFKCTSGTSTLYPSALTFTGAGGSPATRTGVYYATAGYAPATFFVATPTAAGSIIPTVTFTASAAVNAGNSIFCVCERWANARYVSTDAISGVFPASGLSATGTLTPVLSSSVFTWMATDYTATSPQGVVSALYNGVLTGSSYFAGSVVGVNAGYQPSLAAGSPQSYGVSDTIAQKNTLAALELRPIAA